MSLRLPDIQVKKPSGGVPGLDSRFQEAAEEEKEMRFQTGFPARVFQLVSWR